MLRIGDRVVLTQDIPGIGTGKGLRGEVIAVSPDLRIRTKPIEGWPHGDDPAWGWYILPFGFKQLPHQRVDAGPKTL